MFWSMAPLVLACIVLAGVLGMCSFAPNGPGPGPAPPYDAPAALQADADALKFPIRLPKLPEGWHANSGGARQHRGRADRRAGKPARAVTSRVGYLAPTGMFISLTQSDADEDKLDRGRSTPVWCRRARRTSTACSWIVYEGGDRDGTRPGVDDPAEPGRSGPAQTRDNGRRGYRRVPYAGGGDADAVATARRARSAMTHDPVDPKPISPDGRPRRSPARGFTYDVYRKGEGPGVVLIPEMPGIHPGVLALGNHLVDNGFTVACPSLFGTPGAPAMRPGAVPRHAAWLCGKGIRGVRDQRRPADRALPARAGPRPQREDARQGRRRDRPVLHRWLRAWRPPSTTACWRRC